jgi:hypothetical protein
MVKFGVLFEVRTEFLNITQTSFDLKELKYKYFYVNFYSAVASSHISFSKYNYTEKSLYQITRSILACELPVRNVFCLAKFPLNFRILVSVYMLIVSHIT